MSKKRTIPEKGLSDRQLIEKYDSPHIERFNEGLRAMIETNLPTHTEHKPKKGKRGNNSGLPDIGSLPPL